MDIFNNKKDNDPVVALLESINSDKGNTLTMMDFTPGSSRLLKDINTFTSNSTQIDPELYKKYKRYGIEFDQAKYNAGILDKQLAEVQTNWEKLKNALDQTVVNEIVLGTLTGFADLYDIILGRNLKKDEDYQNPVSVYLENLQEQFKQSHDIYQDPTKTDWQHWSDFGWWMNNIPSIMSSLTLLIPGAGVGKGVSYVGRGIGKGLRKATSFTRKAGRALSRAERAEEAAKIGRFERFINTPNVGVISNRLLENSTTALSMRLMENYQESRQVYNDMMGVVKESLDGMTPEERSDFLNRNKDILEQYGVDTSNNEEIAKAISKESADRTFQIDMANIIWDVVQVSTLGNPLKFPKNLRRTAAVNKAQRESKIFAKLGTIEGQKALANRSTKEKVLDWLGDHAKARSIVVAELSEGVEEAVNYVAQQEGVYYGNTMLNPKEYNETLSQRWNDYFNSSELYESAFWGVLGGVMFTGGGSAIKRAYGATVKTAERNRRVNEATQEGGTKTSWRQEYETSENKIRTEEINSRYANLERLKERKNKIYKEGKSPFDDDRDPITGEELTLSTQIEKDAAWQRAIDDFIIRQTFLAIDAGNFDLLKDYLRNEDVKKLIETMAADEDYLVPRIDVENLIKRMDEIEKEYTDNLIMVNGLSAIIKDVPMEYVNIIARNNTMAKLKADRIKAKIDSYEQSARANEFRFGEAIKDALGDATLDYRTAVALITATNFVKELRASKQKILEDKTRAASVDGQLAIKEIDTRIKAINDYIKNLQPSLVGFEGSNVFGVINTLFATQQSLDKDSPEYFDFISAIAGRDIQKINEITGNKFKLTDDEIIKVFGEEGTSDGAYYKLSNELLSHFGVKEGKAKTLPKFVELAPNLSDDYTNLAALNIARLLELSHVANTQSTVNDKVQSLHNEFNQARKAAIKKSNDIIVEKAKKYGSARMIDYVFNNIAIDDISEQDKKELDDALAVLNLSNPLNKNVGDILFKNILLGNYQRGVDEAKERENPSSTEEQNTDSQQSGSDNTSYQQQNGNTSQENGTQPEITPINTQQTQTQAETPNPTPTTEVNREPNAKYRIRVKYDIDKGLEFLFTTLRESNTVPYIEGGTSDNMTYELQIDSDEVSEEQRDKFVSISELFDGYDGNNEGKYKIVKNPVVVKNSEGETTIDKGIIEYIPSEQETTTSSTSSMGEVNETFNEGLNLSEEEARRKEEERKKNERELEIRRQVFGRVLKVAKSAIDTGKTPEQISAAIDAEVEKFKDEVEDSKEFLEGIQNTVNLVKEQYDLINVGNAVIQLRSSTVIENGKIQYTQEFINDIYNLIKEYAKVANIKESTSGKYYINFEDFIRNLNYLYPGMYNGEEVYTTLKDFFTSSYNTQVVIIDNINDPDILENARKTFEQRLTERIGKREHYRIGIDELFEKNGQIFINEFNKLQVGDKLEVTRDEFNRIALTHNGVRVGIMAIPDRIGHNNGFRVTNKGWITDVYPQVNLSTLRNHLSVLAKDDVLNDMINSYLYDNLDDAKKSDLTLKIYSYLKNTSSEFLDEENASPEDIVSWIANIWRYRMTANDFSKPAGERSYRIDKFIDEFFIKLYDSYQAVNDLINTPTSNVTVEVAYINDGELLRAVDDSEIDLTKPRQSRNNYAKFIQSNQAFAKPGEVRVGVVIENGTLGLEGKETIDHTKLGTQGTVHVVIPNRSGKPQFAIATSVLVTDTGIDPRSDAYKIIEESKTYIRRAIDALVNEYSDDNYKNLVTVLSDLFQHDGGHASIFGGVGVSFDAKGNISLKSGNRYLKIYKKDSKEGVDFIYNEGNQDSKAIPYKYSSDSKVLSDAINSIFNTAFFNVDFKFVNDAWNESNGAIGFTGDGKQFIIKVNGKVFRYNSLSEAFINGGLLRVNTRSENGSNYIRKGKNQGGNQVLEVSLRKGTNTPVEKNDAVTTTSSSETTAANILSTEDTNTAVDKLVDTALPNLKKNDKKALKDLGLLPKSITFVTSLQDSDGTEAIAQVNPNTGDTSISQLWIDMYDGNGEYSGNKDFYRKQAIRKLMHEMIHVKIAENDREEILKQVKQIYDEFESYLNGLNEEDRKVFDKYLFKDKTDEAERLEEFLVESFTSQELSERLNSIEAKYEEGELDKSKAKETLWDKIIKLIAKIFNYNFTKTTKDGRTVVNINKRSLLQKELYALAGALNTHAETNVEGDITETVNTEEDEEMFDDDISFDTSDGNSMNSTIIERVKDNPTSTNLSTHTFIISLNPEIQTEAAALIETGELTTLCK